MTDFDRQMMRRALVLARRGVGRTSPNPAVGCVIVKDGKVVGEGWHRKAGTPHAEIHALNAAGPEAAGADVYVTLEPCSHFGKTPPCADALIQARVSRVVAGMVDPNPLVGGRGVDTLRQHGIVVETGLFELECRRLNESFIKHVTTGRPFTILKTAMTMDGKTATSSGDSKWITCDKSRRYVHKLRAQVDAVMVGAGTVAADDPQLTCRTGEGKNPVRIIVDSTARIPLHSYVLNSASLARTMVATTVAGREREMAIQAAGGEVLVCREKNDRVDLNDLFQKLGEIGIQSVLLEGGSTLAGEALHEGLIDKFLLFYAPKLVGGDGTGAFSGSGADLIDSAFRISNLIIRRIGSDVLVEGYPEGACSQD